MPPTTHYMTSHFLQFAHTDRGAYHTLQEGPEHHHKLDMDVAHQTFSNWQGAHVPYTRMEQVLYTYLLRQILLEHATARTPVLLFTDRQCVLTLSPERAAVRVQGVENNGKYFRPKTES